MSSRHFNTWIKQIRKGRNNGSMIVTKDNADARRLWRYGNIYIPLNNPQSGFVYVTGCSC